MTKKTRYALISVYDKTGLIELVSALIKKNITLISTGGTGAFLEKNKIPFIPIEKITKNPESFEGRMKTISFQVLSGILYDRHKKSHIAQKDILNIPDIDYVICNFYPFWKTPGIEMIDVGGPAMVRAAAKNYQSVTIVVNPTEYQSIIDQVTSLGSTTLEKRMELCKKAFSYVSWYDGLINNFFQQESDSPDKTISLFRGQKLRYGENPHQKGFFFQDDSMDQLGLSNFLKRQGKETSYSNYLDLDAGVEAISLIGTIKPAAVILKHTNPCGAAVSDTLEEAFYKAWFDADPLAAFGGVILLNRPVDKRMAEQMLADKKFFEIVAAPGYTGDALKVFAKKPKLQILENASLAKPKLHPYEEIKKVRGGFLVQDTDTRILSKKDFVCVTKTKPKQLDDLLFAWNICKVSKSNCVVVVKDGRMLSSGVGQQDRKRCCELCVIKAMSSLKGSVAATDGFFPFRDGPDVLIKAGITAIIQPGGSIRDQETIDACNDSHVAMVFTNVRAFKH